MSKIVKAFRIRETTQHGLFPVEEYLPMLTGCVTEVFSATCALCIEGWWLSDWQLNPRTLGSILSNCQFFTFLIATCLYFQLRKIFRNHSAWVLFSVLQFVLLVELKTDVLFRTWNPGLIQGGWIVWTLWFTWTNHSCKHSEWWDANQSLRQGSSWWW